MVNNHQSWSLVVFSFQNQKCLTFPRTPHIKVVGVSLQSPSSRHRRRSQQSRLRFCESGAEDKTASSDEVNVREAAGNARAFSRRLVLSPRSRSLLLSLPLCTRGRSRRPPPPRRLSRACARACGARSFAIYHTLCVWWYHTGTRMNPH